MSIDDTIEKLRQKIKLQGKSRSTFETYGYWIRKYSDYCRGKKFESRHVAAEQWLTLDSLVLSAIMTSLRDWRLAVKVLKWVNTWGILIDAPILDRYANLRVLPSSRLASGLCISQGIYTWKTLFVYQ